MISQITKLRKQLSSIKAFSLAWRRPFSSTWTSRARWTRPRSPKSWTRRSRGRLPQPLEIHLPDGATLTMKDRTHRQFNDVLSLGPGRPREHHARRPGGHRQDDVGQTRGQGPGPSLRVYQPVSWRHRDPYLRTDVASGRWLLGLRRIPFIRIYRNGGVFLFDEVDAADGNVMVCVNAALANGMLCNPVTGEVIERHADTPHRHRGQHLRPWW